ncbi:prepilin-type N-terminal cleavage/methylation domain-containing protein [candidate division WOR-3 bacterium]|nr:prepilin-type N-terminal cleavage/methylation domain-containing protein [candidate division WOR-3 bacterium]
MRMRPVDSRGVTLLELLVVMMVLSLILTAAVKTWDVTLERGRFETTRRKLDQLSSAIVGSPDLIVEGKRVDFGYVGDYGDLPVTLNDLVQDRSGLQPESSNWRGPYVRSTFSESPEGYRTDGWGDTIIYSRESLFVRSYGGRGLSDRSRWITREFGYTNVDLTRNEVSGRMLDVRGVPPSESLLVNHPLRFGVELDYPIGGKVQTARGAFNTQGEFLFNIVPQGSQTLRLRYIRDYPPYYDTIQTVRTVTVYPKVGAKGLQIRLDLDWNSQ